MNRSQRVLVTLTVAACADAGRGTQPVGDEPEAPELATASLRGTVDVAAGTLTFESLDVPAEVRPASIYGNQGVTVRLYNTPVTVAASATPGKETYTANVGLQNRLAFPIGDEQAGVTPLDTMGIYVFVNAGPAVTATSSPCSPACTVTVRNAHGRLGFVTPAQQYWHWNERVGAFGGGSDTTRARKTWVFEADTQVTAFSFDVLVSAAWPPPHDTRWRMSYEGDSVPDVGAEPRWTRNATGTSTFTLNSPSTDILTIVVPALGRVAFYASDSLATATNAYIESRFRTNTAIMVGPEVSFGIDDNVKFIAAGISGSQAGFLSSSFAFLAGAVTETTTSFHTYEIRKFAADSVQLWIDGVRRVSRAYSTFSATSPSRRTDSTSARPAPAQTPPACSGTPRAGTTSSTRSA